jgi:hypothetical protein
MFMPQDSAFRHLFCETSGLGDKERTLQAMEGSTAAGPFRVGRALAWPELALIRAEPRIKTLRKKVGLPE